jgi:hypothetical protein
MHVWMQTKVIFVSRSSSTVSGRYSLSADPCMSTRLYPRSIREDSLGGRVVDKLDALGDVTLEAIVACLEELLLVVICAADNVDGLLGAVGAKLDRHGEEVGAGGLCDGVAAGDTWQVDEAGLDDALLALGGLDDLLGESGLVSQVYAGVFEMSYR